MSRTSKIKTKENEGLFALNHDRLCRYFISMNIGRNIRVSLSNGTELSGVVEKIGRRYKIGKKYLNGKLVTEVR